MPQSKERKRIVRYSTMRISYVRRMYSDAYLASLSVTHWDINDAVMALLNNA